MVRLAPDSSYRTRTAAQCLETARRALGPQSGALKSVQFVPSGLALVPTNLSLRPHLLAKAGQLQTAFNALSIDEQTGRDSFMIAYAPRFVSPFSSDTLTPEAYTAEITAVLGTAPAHVHMADNKQEDSCTLFAFFPRGKVSTGRSLMLFGARLKLHKLQPRARKTTQCSRCFGFHPVRGCSRPALCDTCGSAKHLAAEHPVLSSDAEDLIARCCNCLGPHLASTPECPARASLSSVPRASKAELQALRAHQRKERQVQVKAMAAAIKAKADEVSAHPNPFLSAGSHAAESETDPDDL
ncbi:hypothetical protein AAP_00439 [Ascosphaera apis ARSEF 7405]|uniref:Uncharacterized protein n=1 Tax=Ascosphaera apis ARSEF 7405 TaxID=392613 RepID=A0A168DW52_9EURO|nr:hypothetical protein AAP_00439 [Ascosphaera apis ARSEF 7405]